MIIYQAVKVLRPDLAGSIPGAPQFRDAGQIAPCQGSSKLLQRQQYHRWKQRYNESHGYPDQRAGNHHGI